MNTIVEPVDAGRWRELTCQFRDHNYRHLWAFGCAAAARLGAQSEHIAIREHERLLALANVRTRRIPMIGGGLAYISGGPLVQRNERGDTEALRLCLEALQREFVQRRGCVLRVAPPLGADDWNTLVSEQFTAAGFGRAERARVYRTIVVDISDSPERIRQRLQQKWRNCLNAAERNAINVHCGEGAELLVTFRGLFDELTARKGFDVELDAAFYARVQEHLEPNERFTVLIARVAGAPAAGMLVSLHGDTAVYLLGASNERGHQSKAAYLLQWRSILAAKERGCTRYDLGGIDPVGNPGVYHFKCGLGGADITAPGPFECAPSGLRRLVTLGGERLYRRLRQRHRTGAAATAST